MYFLAALVLLCVDVMVMLSAWAMPELMLWVVVCLQYKCRILLVKGHHLVEPQF